MWQLRRARLDFLRTRPKRRLLTRGRFPSNRTPSSSLAPSSQLLPLIVLRAQRFISCTVVLAPHRGARVVLDRRRAFDSERRRELREQTYVQFFKHVAHQLALVNPVAPHRVRGVADRVFRARDLFAPAPSSMFSSRSTRTRAGSVCPD